MTMKQKQAKIRQIYTIFRFCENYHSGQASRGYRLLCRCQRKLNRLDKRVMNTFRHNIEIVHNLFFDSTLYRHLTKNYGETI